MARDLGLGPRLELHGDGHTDRVVELGAVPSTGTVSDSYDNAIAEPVNNLHKTERVELLIGWMTGNATGDTLIRAGAPSGWRVADKSGAGGYGTRNDLAIVFPPEGGPIFVAVMTTTSSQAAEPADSLVAEAADATLSALGRTIEDAG